MRPSAVRFNGANLKPVEAGFIINKMPVTFWASLPWFCAKPARSVRVAGTSPIWVMAFVDNTSAAVSVAHFASLITECQALQAGD